MEFKIHDKKEPQNVNDPTIQFGGTTYSSIEYERIASNLRKSLGPEYISNRSGPGGVKISYLEGWKATHLANELFGFNGWSNRIMDVTCDFMDVENGKVSVGVSVIMRITLKDGTYREDIGYGSMENAKSKSAAFDKAKKEAVTDGMKRALKNLGSALGACLYDKEFLKKIKGVKVPERKFDPNLLYRAPEFRTVAPRTTDQPQHGQHIPAKPITSIATPSNQIIQPSAGATFGTLKSEIIIRSEFEEEDYSFFDHEMYGSCLFTSDIGTRCS